MPAGNRQQDACWLQAHTNGAPDGEDQVGKEAREEQGVAKGRVLDCRVVQPRVPVEPEGVRCSFRRDNQMKAPAQATNAAAGSAVRSRSSSVGGEMLGCFHALRASVQASDGGAFPQHSACPGRAGPHQRMYAPGTPPTNQMAPHRNAAIAPPSVISSATVPIKLKNRHQIRPCASGRPKAETEAC